MPHSLQNLDPKDIKNKPNTKSYVFVKVNKSLKNFHIEDELDGSSDLTVDLETGDQHLVMYKPFRDLLNSDEVSLI